MLREPQYAAVAAATVLVAAAQLLFSLHSAFASDRTYDDSEGYKLLSMMIEREAKDWESHHLQISNLQIYNRNVRAFPCPNIPAEFRAAAEDMAKIPDEHFRFTRKFKLHSSYSLEGSGDITITAVGFDSSRAHAIAYISRGCGAMCSGGFTYLFRKDNEGWKIFGRLCETMS